MTSCVWLFRYTQLKSVLNSVAVAQGVGMRIFRRNTFSKSVLEVYCLQIASCHNFITRYSVHGTLAPGRDISTGETLLAGAIAGGAATFATHPPDVVILTKFICTKNLSAMISYLSKKYHGFHLKQLHCMYFIHR